jgi:hypothetical protein
MGAGTLDYVTSQLIANRQNAAEDAALSAAQGDISSPLARDIIPEFDFNDTGATAFDGSQKEFVQTPSDSTGEVDVYEIDSDTGKADERVYAIYGFQADAGAEFVDVVQFRDSSGRVFERAQVQGLDETGDQPVDRQVVLDEPVLFEPQDNGTITFVVNDAFDPSGTDAIKLKLLGITVEKEGRTIANRS